MPWGNKERIGVSLVQRERVLRELRYETQGRVAEAVDLLLSRETQVVIGAWRTTPSASGPAQLWTTGYRDQ